MGRKKTTNNPTVLKPEITGKPPDAASETAHFAQRHLAVLKECGDHLDQHPLTLTNWTAPIPPGIATVRELVMRTMLKIRDKRGRLLRAAP